MAISMAPDLSRVYVYEAPNTELAWVDMLSRMANDNLSKQLSCSWGGGSPDAASEQIFKQMGAQGQSFFCASGDSDAFTGSVPFPSDSPNITIVGGTTLTTGARASYQSETVWNWGLQSGSYVGSSGGISTYYSLPAYQQGISMSANQGSTTMRNVPDVAFVADNVYVDLRQRQSYRSPAAPVARRRSWRGLHRPDQPAGGRLGAGPGRLPEPRALRHWPGDELCRRIPRHHRRKQLQRSSPSRFAAVAGYDLCTGWGTPNGTALINALIGPPVFKPNILSNSFILLAEGCPNGVVDPAETVTVNFGLANTGTASTTNLVATLLPTSGILFPSGPQTYGVLGPNGAAVLRPFTFTANGTCGDTNTASLQLQDGAAESGNAYLLFPAGPASDATTVFSENFDGVTLPALPAGWTHFGQRRGIRLGQLTRPRAIPRPTPPSRPNPPASA